MVHTMPLSFLPCFLRTPDCESLLDIENVGPYAQNENGRKGLAYRVVAMRLLSKERGGLARTDSPVIDDRVCLLGGSS